MNSITKRFHLSKSQIILILTTCMQYKCNICMCCLCKQISYFFNDMNLKLGKVFKFEKSLFFHSF